MMKRKPKSALALALLVGVGCNRGAGAPPLSLSDVVPEGTARAAGVLQVLPPKTPQPLDPGHHPVGPPLSLTSTDGTGLKIVSFKARAVVEDPLAFTELDLVFQNPQQRQIEGQFEITLPEGATISRFAMRQGDTWQEGEVVELQAARQAYEDFLHRRQDPALLEKQAGNSFRARVFPIPPGGTKELMVSFSQERARAADPYRIFLRGLPKLDALDIRAIVGKTQGGGTASSLGGTTLSHQIVEVRRDHFTPDVDFEVAVPPPAAQLAGLRHDNLAVARVTPVADERPDPIESSRGLTVLFDTSASRALGFAEQVQRLGDFLKELQKSGGKLPLRVLCFDQETEEIYKGDVSGFGAGQLERVRTRRPLGASDVARALAAAGQGGGGRVVLFSDGVATAGLTEGNDLRKAVAGLKGTGVQRLDAVAFGGIRDESGLKKLVTAGLSADGVVVDGDQPLSTVLRKLSSATVSGIKVDVPGAAWVWPMQLDGVQPGDQVLVYADLPKDRPYEVRLAGAAGTQTLTGALNQVTRPLLERAWVNARIQRLMHQRDTLAESDPDLREALRHQIVDLSTKFRVLSDFTALLVLETEWDYQRFHIDRRALSDILTVGPGGIDLINRTQPQVVTTPPPRPIQPVRTEAAPPKTPASPLRPVQKPRDEESRADKKELAKDSGSTSREPTRANIRSAPAAKMDVDASGDLGGLAAPGGPRGGHMGASAGAAPSGYGAGGGAATGRAMAPPPPPAAEPAMAPPRPRPAAAPRMADKAAEAMPESSARDRRAANEQERRATRSADDASPAPADPARIIRGDAPARPVVVQSNRIVVNRPPPPTSRPALQIARPEPEPPQVIPYEGKLLGVMTHLKNRRVTDAVRDAWAWRDSDAGDVLALIGLGEALEAAGQPRTAARAYGSLVDLFPGRADLRRFAGERLERLGKDGAGMSVDTYKKAREQRPDHPASHRLLAFALLRAGQPGAAFEVIAEGARRSYPSGRFAGVTRILLEDVGLIAAAWIRAEPARRAEIESRVSALGGRIPDQPSLRFVLNWETDANDVDFHIYDGQGGHAFYSQRQLGSGGELYADVTTGYGPECFTIEGRPQAYPYRLQAHYYSRGPMGYGMGKLEIIEHDGHGGLRFNERPFVIMVDQAFVDLGQVKGPLGSEATLAR